MDNVFSWIVITILFALAVAIFFKKAYDEYEQRQSESEREWQKLEKEWKENNWSDFN